MDSLCSLPAQQVQLPSSCQYYLSGVVERVLEPLYRGHHWDQQFCVEHIVAMFPCYTLAETCAMSNSTAKLLTSAVLLRTTLLKRSVRPLLPVLYIYIYNWENENFLLYRVVGCWLFWVFWSLERNGQDFQKCPLYWGYPLWGVSVKWCSTAHMPKLAFHPFSTGWIWSPGLGNSDSMWSMVYDFVYMWTGK